MPKAGLPFAFAVDEVTAEVGNVEDEGEVALVEVELDVVEGDTSPELDWILDLLDDEGEPAESWGMAAPSPKDAPSAASDSSVIEPDRISS